MKNSKLGAIAKIKAVIASRKKKSGAPTAKKKMTPLMRADKDRGAC